MKRFAIITGILSGLLFGVATPFSKLLLDGLNSFQLAGLLYLGAALAMFPYIFVLSRIISLGTYYFNCSLNICCNSYKSFKS